MLIRLCLAFAILLSAQTARAACRAFDPEVARRAETALAGLRPGVAVHAMREGRTVLACADGVADRATGTAVGEQTVFRLASATKPFTAAAVLKLVERGDAALTDPLSRWVSELPDADKVTLDQLLTHTSGLPDFTEAADYPAHRPRDHTPAEMVAWIARLDGRAPAGQRWRYSNSGYQLLGMVLSRATGTPLAQAYQDLLFTPAGVSGVALDDGRIGPSVANGAKRSRTTPGGFVEPEPISMTLPGAAGALAGTARAAAEAIQAIFDGKVLGPEMLARYRGPGRLTDGRATRWGMPDDWREGLRADYGYGWFVDEAAGGARLWHGGDIDGFTSRVSHYPKQDLTLVILTNVENAELPADALEAALLDLPPTPPNR